MQKCEALDKQRWNDFIIKHGPRSGAFLYAWEWSEMALGHRYEFWENDELIGLASVGYVFLPFGQSYLSCIYGPITFRQEKILEMLELLNSTEAIFARFEPAEEIKNRRVKKTRSITPPTTLITSLELKIEDLLSQMHHKTRYNIFLAERKGVKVRFLTAADLTAVWPLFTETAERDSFRLHSKKHYEDLLNFKSEDLKIFLVGAYFENQLLAANIMVDFNGVRTYLHGASSSKKRNLMGPYLLHWELMKEAKEKGLKFYDWWGIAKTDDPKDPWAGITRFKKGFGGEVVSYPGTFDYVLNPFKYFVYNALRKIVRKIR
ncbi:MAG: peptidoglycan bridge formation glycyltransferase FemA/FemB family protein [Candidatus Uhrbacteria bacterium]